MIKPGDTAIIDKTFWAKIQNPEGHRNCNSSYEFEDDAVFCAGQTLRAIAVRGDEVLCRLSSITSGGGTSAATGAMCFVSQEVFSSMSNNFYAQQSAQRARADTVRELIRSSKIS